VDTLQALELAAAIGAELSGRLRPSGAQADQNLAKGRIEPAPASGCTRSCLRRGLPNELERICHDEDLAERGIGLAGGGEPRHRSSASAGLPWRWLRMRYANSAGHLAQWWRATRNSTKCIRVALKRSLPSWHWLQEVRVPPRQVRKMLEAGRAGDRAADIATAVRHLAERTIVEDERRKANATRTLQGLGSGSSVKTLEHSGA